MRRTILTLALLALPSLAMATGNRDSGFGTFHTGGHTGALSIGGGMAESFSDHSAGLSLTRCNTCGGFTFQGFTTNASGAQSQGPAAAWGSGGGAAQGFTRFRNR